MIATYRRGAGGQLRLFRPTLRTYLESGSRNRLDLSGDTPMTTTFHKLSIWKIAAAAAALAFAPAVLASPAAADTDAQATSAHHARATHHHARAHVRHSYARVYAPAPWTVDEWGADFRSHPYHCGIGLYNTPLACEPGD